MATGHEDLGDYIELYGECEGEPLQVAFTGIGDPVLVFEA